MNECVAVETIDKQVLLFKKCSKIQSDQVKSIDDEIDVV